MQSGKWWLTYINYLFASAIFFFLLMCCAADRYFALCSGREGKPWHESWVVMHWWLVSNYLFTLFDVPPHISFVFLTFISFQGSLFLIFWAISWPFHYLVLYYTASGKAAEFGQLKDGYMFESSTGLSRMWEFFSPFNSYLIFDIWQIFLKYRYVPELMVTI